jgi:hypothetical protein
MTSAPASQEKVPARPKRLLGCPVGCAVVIGAFITVLALAVLLVPFIMRYQMRRNFSPDQVRALNSLEHDPVDFPPAWLHVTAFSEATLRDAEAMLTDYRRDLQGRKEELRDPSVTHALSALNSGQSCSQDLWSTLTRLADFGTSTLTSIRALSSRPDYEIEAAESVAGSHLGWQEMIARTACISAHVSNRDGNTTRALELTRLALGACRSRGAPQTPFSSLMVVPARNLALQTMAAVLRDTSSTELLGPQLRFLDELHEDFTTIPAALVGVSDALTALRRYARDGYPADLQPGRPAQYYILQQWLANTEYPPWMLARLRIGDPRAERIKQMTAQRTMPGLPMLSPRAWLYVMHYVQPDFPAYFALSSIPASMQQLRQYSIVYYHLLRLWLADRIARPQPAYDLESVYARIAAGSPQSIMDPYSARGERYQYDTARQQFYSVGQDGRSQHDGAASTTPGYIGDDLTLPLLPSSQTGVKSTTSRPRR